MLLSPLFQSLQFSWRDSSPGKTYTALQTSTYSIFFGTLLLAIFAPASFQEIADAPAIQYLYLAILGVCSSAAAYVSWAKAFSKAKQTADAVTTIQDQQEYLESAELRDKLYINSFFRQYN